MPKIRFQNRCAEILAIAKICDGQDGYSPEDAIRIVLVLIGLRHVHEYKVR